MSGRGKALSFCVALSFQLQDPPVAQLTNYSFVCCWLFGRSKLVARRTKHTCYNERRIMNVLTTSMRLILSRIPCTLDWITAPLPPSHFRRRSNAVRTATRLSCDSYSTLGSQRESTGSRAAVWAGLVGVQTARLNSAAHI